MTQVKTCFDCKMFEVPNWVAYLNGENGPRGTPSHEALSVSYQGALEISAVAGQPSSLGRNYFCTPRLVEKSHLVMRGADLPKDHSIQLFTDASNEGWGAHLEQTSTKGSVVRQGNKATHKCSRAEGSFSGPSKVEGPVSEPNSVSCHRQLNSGDLRSPVEDHDLVPSLPDNTNGQTHSRVSECDGRPAVQVQPSSVRCSNRSVSFGSLLM